MGIYTNLHQRFLGSIYFSYLCYHRVALPFSAGSLRENSMTHPKPGFFTGQDPARGSSQESFFETSRVWSGWARRCSNFFPQVRSDRKLRRSSKSRLGLGHRGSGGMALTRPVNSMTHPTPSFLKGQDPARGSGQERFFETSRVSVGLGREVFEIFSRVGSGRFERRVLR